MPEINEIDKLFHAVVGDFGKWQFKISVLMALMKFPVAWFQLSIVFLAPPTEFWCKSSMNFTEKLQKHDEGLNSGYCQSVNHKNNTTTMVDCLDGFYYKRTIFQSTIITEWDLVCDRKRYGDITQITLMLGILIGNILFGVLADRHGRKKILIMCIFIQSLFGITAAFVPWFWGFVVLRFLMALANGGIAVISFVLCMEVVGGIWRNIVPILYQIPFGFGTSIMAGLAYRFRNWRELQLALSLLSSIYLLYYWCIPESPKWLWAIGRKKQALDEIEDAAKCNKVEIEKISTTISFSGIRNSHEKPNLTNLFEKPLLRIRTILLCINWFIVGITFFAFSQYTGKIAKNIFYTTALSGFVALPGTILCVLVVKHFGRRWTIASAHILTAGCFFAILTFPSGVYVQDWPRILFAGIGIIGLSISMPALFLFTGELFPTTLRNAGVGLTVMCSRLGSIVAPLIIAMEDVSEYMPLLILGFLGIVETLLILLLPETKGRNLEDTINDI